VNAAIQKQSRIRRSALNAGMVLASVVICLSLLEVALRVYSVLIFPKMMVLDDKLGWRHAANVSRTFVNELGEEALVTHNVYGHRGNVHSLENNSGSFRILVLGDSFTEGVQVGEEELFTAHLERSDSRLEVLNAGVGGYGTVQEYLYLASEGLKFNPNLVVLMFYENDMTDNGLSYYPGFGPRPYARMDSDKFQLIETLDSAAYEKFTLPLPFRMALNNYSYFYYFLNSRIYQRLTAPQMLQWQKADLQRLDTETRYRLFFGSLARIQGSLPDGMSLLLVVIPSREDTVRGSSQLALRIQEYCAKTNTECLTLLDRFHKENSSGAALYFAEDIHWTKAGHKLAAVEILRKVSELRLAGSLAQSTAPFGELAHSFISK
jgi:lysophospholipase L1-like esterase